MATNAQINTQVGFTFLHQEINEFQFYNRQFLDEFYKKLSTTDNAKISVLHIGDSHIQADKFTGLVRNVLQEKFGNAGRGLVYPYSTAHTHAAADYSTLHRGRWLYAKNVELEPEVTMGICGAGSHTIDTNAQFSFYFKNTIPENDTKLTLFCNTSAGAFDIILNTEYETIPVKVNNGSNAGFVQINLQKGSNTLTFKINKTDSTQNFFEVYGLLIENPTNKGVLYNSTGINGASTFGILREHLFAEHLKFLKPDMVVIDIGVNDYYRHGLNRSEFYANYSKIITNIRKQFPSVCIVLNSVQDAGRGGYSHPDGPNMSELVKDMAKTFRCAFWDWFYIAGGKKSIFKWNATQLAAWDMIHLTNDGYKTKGMLFANAIFKTAQYLKQNPDSSTHIFNIDTIINPPVDSAALRAEEEARQQRIREQQQYAYQWIYHRVSYGQNIWNLAYIYGVSAYQIKVWNRMRTNNVYRGQILKIYTRVKVAQQPVPAPKPKTDTANTVKKPNTPASTPAVKPPVQKPANQPIKKPVPKIQPVYHKVKAGESLYSISLKYKTTVVAIQKLNGMRNYNIKPGQTIRVK